MSDFCDSLDDETYDKISLDSLENIEADASKKSKCLDRAFTFCLQEPFHLHNKNLNTNKSNLFPIFIENPGNGSSETSGNSRSESNFSGNKNSDAEKSVRFNPEDELLIKKGLQRNVDGSFSKSPHQDVENDLPFVSKEFKTLNFQRKKSSIPKKIVKKFDLLPKKTLFNFSENLRDMENMLSIMGHRLEKGSSEEVLTSRGSCSRGETDISHYKIEDNLTDSMKEELIRTLQKDQLKCMKNKKSNQKLLNSVSETQNLEKINRKNIPNSTLIRERSKAFTNTNHPRCEISKKEEVICCQSSARKHKSDIVLPSKIKPRLSYLERYQKENGFEPLCIRQDNKPTPSDTNRSNYGDSVVEVLSEISSTLPKEEGEEEDEDEESFYRKWIQQEKELKEKGNKINLPCLVAPSSNIRRNDFVKVAGNGGSTTKSSVRIASSVSKSTVTRLTPIDLPLSKRTLSPRSSHYCLSERSSTSKAELISKAKTYGQLANSRNLFKMKMQSQNKLSAPTFNKYFEYLKSQTRFLKQDDNNCSDESDDNSKVHLPFVSTQIRKRSEEAFKLIKKEDKRKNSDLLLPLINFGNPGKRFEFRS